MITELNDSLTQWMGDAMDCHRVWSAWRVGTMSADDFSLIIEDDDRMAELRAAATSVMGPEIQNLVRSLEQLMKVEAPNHEKNWISKRLTCDEQREVLQAWSQARKALERAQHVLREIKSNDPWVPWAGGKCPFEDDINIMVRFRDDRVEGTARPSSLTWVHIGDDTDIVAYTIQGCMR